MSFEAAFIAFYVGHHVGDYWVQTDAQARHKGAAGADGVLHCLLHVISYLVTQVVFLGLAALSTGEGSGPFWPVWLALLVSGLAHYAADRREHGILPVLARLIPGKRSFYRLGAPRGGHYDDPPQLATGAWALDQSWHILTSVFVPALIIGGLS